MNRVEREFRRSVKMNNEEGKETQKKEVEKAIEKIKTARSFVVMYENEDGGGCIAILDPKGLPSMHSNCRKMEKQIKQTIMEVLEDIL